MAELARRLIFSEDEDEHILDISPRIKRCLNRPTYFNIYDETQFKCRFRLSKESVLQILTQIENQLEFKSNRNNSVSPMNQLLIALRYYATGSVALTLGDFGGVSKTSANRIILKVSKAICSLMKNYVKFPTTDEEITDTQLLNYRVARFPTVLAMIDCTHIKIESPGGDQAELFRNRKGYFSLNVQVMCNANLEIMDLVARWPGSTHDSTIFNACYRRAMFEDNRYRDGLLLGDSGYSLLKYLMTPIENPVSRAEQLYNESHIRTRNCIERLFGIWKRRFPVLALGFKLKLRNILPVITATAVLHNILRLAGDELPQDDDDLHLPLPWEELLAQSQINNMSTNAPRQRAGLRLRNALITDYFQRLQ